MKRHILAFLLMLLSVSVFADITLSDSAFVSLLTCTPGTEAYSKFGHSAIRVCDKVNGLDLAFNYGSFSFNTDHFYLRFAQGQTYYQLAIEPTDYFIVSSAYIGRITYEQQLNLDKEQKQALFDALMTNYLPRNRKYLYNFVFDNCATRPYNLLLQVLSDQGKTLAAPQFEQRKDTYRERITYYAEHNSWLGFAINLIFGKSADRQMTTAERLFLPEELMDFVSEAVFDDGTRFCGQENVRPFNVRSHSWWLSPAAFLLLVMLLLIALTVFDFVRQKQSFWADAVLYLAGALLGSIMVYLSYFSIHPLVEHNYNLLLINPLLLVLFVLTLFGKGREWLQSKGLWISLLFLLLFIVRVFCGQTWHLLMYLPLVHALRMAVLSKVKRLPFRLGSRRMLVLLLFFAGGIIANASPRLTVVIAVDGFSQSAMDELRPYWQADGLRLLEEEAHKSTMNFNQLVFGGSETLATIVTGVNPSVHNVSMERFFLRADRRTHSVFDDQQEMCIGCPLHISPRALLMTTVADEFRQQTSDRSRLFAVGVNSSQTLLLAGHAADACAWIEPDSLRWVTTGYYSAGLPTAADQMNINGRFRQLAEREWQPRLDINAYMHPTEEEKNKPFAYKSAEDISRMPVANTLVIELALALQKDEKLGTRQTQDMLLLGLNVVTPRSKSDRLMTAEQEDMYLSLNQDLGFLFEQLDKRVGHDNYRVVIFGTPHYGMGVERAQKSNMQVQAFSTDRAAALINTYLMAIYGHERWIDGGYGHSIYLNRTLLEQKKMSVSDMQQQVADFLTEFSGVQNAFPASKLLSLKCADCLMLQNTYNKQQFGDVLFTLQPMWVTEQDRVVEQNITAPLYIWTQERTYFPADNIDATEAKRLILK